MAVREDLSKLSLWPCATGEPIAGPKTILRGRLRDSKVVSQTREFAGLLAKLQNRSSATSPGALAKDVKVLRQLRIPWIVYRLKRAARVETHANVRELLKEMCKGSRAVGSEDTAPA